MNQPNDSFSIKFTDVRRPVEREYITTRGVPLAYRVIVDELLVPLSARMIDLLRLASTVYMVDRLVKRERKIGGNWGRTLKCSVTVRDIDFWRSPSVSSLLRDCVAFVSGDSWEFDIVPDRSTFDLEWQRPLPGVVAFNPKVCLYSGGLDSAAGLVLQLLSNPNQPIIPVTVRHRSDLGATVARQLATISSRFNVRLRPLIVPFGMDTPSKVVGNEETSQRARAFLFVSVGGVVACATNASVLELYESGIGAINAPLLAGMQGSQATRSCHPMFLGMMSQILGEVSGQRIDVQLPFARKTKGEIVRSLQLADLQNVALASVSCVAYPLRQAAAKSCGLCPACIFRRVALHAAGIEELEGTYQFDLLSPNSPPQSPQRMKYLMAFLNQIDSLSTMSGDQLPISVAKHLTQTGLIEIKASQQPFVELYSKYHREWLSFIRTAKAKGCRWSNLIDLPAKAA